MHKNDHLVVVFRNEAEVSLNNINNSMNAVNATANYHEAKSVTPIKKRHQHQQQSFERRVSH